MTVNISFKSLTALTLFLFQYMFAYACSEMNLIDITPFGLYIFSSFSIICVGIHLSISIGRLLCYFIHLTMGEPSPPDRIFHRSLAFISFFSLFFIFFIKIKFWCFYSIVVYARLAPTKCPQKKSESNKNLTSSGSILPIVSNKKSNRYYPFRCENQVICILLYVCIVLKLA